MRDDTDLVQTLATTKPPPPPDPSRNPVQDSLLGQLANLAMSQTGASGAAIAIEHDGEMICRATVGSVAPDLGLSINKNAGLSGLCLSTRRTQWCVNTEEDSRVDSEACRHLGVQSIVVMPLFEGDRVVGVFEVFSSEPNAFSTGDLQILHDLAGQVMERIERAGGETVGTKSIVIPTPAASPRIHPEDIYSTTAKATKRDYKKVVLSALALLLAMLLALAVGFYWGWQKAVALKLSGTTSNALPATVLAESAVNGLSPPPER